MVEPTPVPPEEIPTGPEARKVAWDQFYRYCFGIIQNCPAAQKLNEVDREDCVQEVMTEIVRRFGNGHEAPAEDLKGLLLTLTRNKAADIQRRKYRKPEVSFEDGSGAAVSSAAQGRDAGPVGPDQSERLSLVWEALTTLDQQVPITSYLAFYLRTIEDWTIPEIAELLQLTPEQTRVRCHRVRKRFAEILSGQAGQADGLP